MAINIRREATLAAAHRLSALTGEPMVTEIEKAVLERLARLESEDTRTRDRVDRISKDAAARWPEHLATGDPTEQLYDGAGLPA